MLRAEEAAETVAVTPLATKEMESERTAPSVSSAPTVGPRKRLMVFHEALVVARFDALDFHPILRLI